MSELVHQLPRKEYETPELFSKRVELEGLTPQQLEDLITDCFNQKRELDEIIELAIDVRENGYGEVAA